jgi:hypothetical protein
MSWIIIGLVAWILMSAIVCVPLGMIASQCTRREEASRSQRRPAYGPPARYSGPRLTTGAAFQRHSGD